MAWYKILAVVIGSAAAIFIALWFIVLVWEAFFVNKKRAEETLITHIVDWFEELTLKINDWLMS